MTGKSPRMRLKQKLIFFVPQYLTIRQGVANHLEGDTSGRSGGQNFINFAEN